MISFVSGSSLFSFGLKGTNYCGPSYSNGVLGAEPDESGQVTGPVDEQCKTHDLAYVAADASATPALGILKADIHLIEGLSALKKAGNLTSGETEMATLISGAFVEKIALWDIAQATPEAARSLIADAANTLQEARAAAAAQPIVVDSTAGPLALGRQGLSAIAQAFSVFSNKGRDTVDAPDSEWGLKTSSTQPVRFANDGIAVRFGQPSGAYDAGNVPGTGSIDALVSAMGSFAPEVSSNLTLPADDGFAGSPLAWAVSSASLPGPG